MLNVSKKVQCPSTQMTAQPWQKQKRRLGKTRCEYIDIRISWNMEVKAQRRSLSQSGRGTCGIDESWVPPDPLELVDGNDWELQRHHQHQLTMSLKKEKSSRCSALEVLTFPRQLREAEDTGVCPLQQSLRDTQQTFPHQN